MKQAFSVKTYIIMPLVTGLISLVTYQAAFAADKSFNDEATALLALPTVGSLAGPNISDTASELVQDYISSQIAANGISKEQFKGLTIDQQRQVLLPGRQFHLSREVARTIMVKRTAVPTSVTEKIEAGQTISEETITKYGVTLPESLNTIMGVLPQGHQRIMIGNELVLLDKQNTILDVAEAMY